MNSLFECLDCGYLSKGNLQQPFETNLGVNPSPMLCLDRPSLSSICSYSDFGDES